MKTSLHLATTLAVLCLLAGCRGGQRPLAGPPQTLGTIVDQINMTQEENAEPAKAIVYQHEFELNTDANRGWRLNDYGEDHVKQIAANLRKGEGATTVVIERSQTSVKPGVEDSLPVHYNDRLDDMRRQVVVSALASLGVSDAESRVVVAPAYPEGLPGNEAIRAYRQTQRSRNNWGGGFGGFGFGGFGLGFQ